MLPLATGDATTWGDEAAMARNHGHQPDAMLPPFRLHRREVKDWLPFSQKKRTPLDGGRNCLAKTSTVASPRVPPLMSSTTMQKPSISASSPPPVHHHGDIQSKEEAAWPPAEPGHTVDEFIQRRAGAPTRPPRRRLPPRTPAEEEDQPVAGAARRCSRPAPTHQEEKKTGIRHEPTQTNNKYIHQGTEHLLHPFPNRRRRRRRSGLGPGLRSGRARSPPFFHLPLSSFPLPISMESCSFRTATSPSPFSSAPSSSSSPRAPCPNLRFARERNGRQMRMRRRASGFDAFPPLPGKVFVEETIGAEYGEGFETFRMDGPLNIDVDYLNEKLQECFLQRIRHAMKPDEAFGLIFSWDNVIADTDSLKLDAWRQLALEEGKDIPTAAHIQRSILHGAADHVLRKVLYWAKEDDQMDRLKARLIELYYESLFKLDTPVEGLREWLDAVRTAGIPCAVASSLDRRCMVEALDRMSLSKYFKAIVTDEDDMESIAHRFLSAAVKLDRKPSKCIVFEDDPRGVTAAHNCTMMAVSLIGAHPAYELEQADLAVAKYNDLSVINLRRLFAHKGISFMDMQKQIIERSPPKRKLTVDTIF